MRPISPLLLAAAALVGCIEPAPASKPADLELQLSDVDVEELDLEEARGELRFTYANPWPEAVALDELRWDLLVGGEDHVASRTIRDPVMLPAGQSGTFTLPLVVPWSSVDRALAAYPERDELDWNLQGTAVLRTPEGPRDLSFSDSGELPVLHAPRLEPTELRMRSLDLQSRTAAADLVLDVGSRQARALRDLSFTVALDDQEVLRGQRPNQVFDLRGEHLVLPVQLDLSGIAPETLHALQREGEVDLSLVLRGDLETVHGTVDLDVERDARLEVVGRPVM